MLEIEGINVFYGNIPALVEVSLSVENHQTASIVGANGAGKTTLLKTISGLLQPRGGRIRFKDKDIIGVPPYEIVARGLVLIPEGRKIFPSLTVLENLELGSYHGRAKRRRRESLPKVFSLFPLLEERKKQTAGTLSGGEQQLLAIGRGLMALPDLLMLDEPSLGLAPLMVKEIFRIVQEINRLETTILLVEQNVFHSLNLCNYGYILENGRVILEGVGKELLRQEHTKKAYLGM